MKSSTLISVLLLLPVLAPAAAQESPPEAGIRVLGRSVLPTKSEITRIAFSPDGAHLALGTRSEGVVIWDPDTSREVRRFACLGIVSDLRYLAGGSRLVVKSWDADRRLAETMVWDFEKGASTGRFPAPYGYGRLAVAPDDSVLISPEAGGRTGLLVLDLATGEQKAVLKDAARSAPKLSYSVSHLALSPDGKLLAVVDTCRGAEGGAGIDPVKRMSLWDWRNGRRLSDWTIRLPYFHEANEVHWMADGKRLLMSSSQGSILAKAEDGAELRRFEGHAVPLPGGEQIVVIGKGTLSTVDAATGVAVQTLELPMPNHLGAPLASADGRWIAASNWSQSIFLADRKNRRRVLPDEGALTAQPHVAYAPDGRFMASDPGATIFHDETTGRILSRFPAQSYVVAGRRTISPDGRLLYAVGGPDGHAQVWDSAHGVLAGRLTQGPGRSGGVQQLHLSADGRWAGTIREYTGSLRFHDLATGQALGRILGPEHSFFGRTLHIGACRWNAKGNLVFVACANTGWFSGEAPVRPGDPDVVSFTGVFDPATGKLVRPFKDSHGVEVADAETLDLHEPSDLVYLGHKEVNGLWKASTGAFIRQVADPGPGARFVRDGAWLLGPDALVDVATGGALRRFEQGTLRFPSPSGTRVAALDARGRIAILETETGAEIASRTVPGVGELADLAWHPGELQVAVVPKGRALAILVDLVRPPADPPAVPEPGLLQAMARQLPSKEAAERDQAVGILTAGGAAAVPALKDTLAAGSNDGRGPSIAFHVIDLLARAGIEDARIVIREHAGQPGLKGRLADGILRRQKAEAGARDLRGKLKSTGPIKLEWKQD